MLQIIDCTQTAIMNFISEKARQILQSSTVMRLHQSTVGTCNILLFTLSHHSHISISSRQKQLQKTPIPSIIKHIGHRAQLLRHPHNRFPVKSIHRAIVVRGIKVRKPSIRRLHLDFTRVRPPPPQRTAAASRR